MKKLTHDLVGLAVLCVVYMDLVGTGQKHASSRD